MNNPSPVFQKNYEDYLRQLNEASAANWAAVLGIDMEENEKTAKIPFLGKLYTVTPESISDEQGNHPDYGVCVILLKYLLMCPESIPAETNWVHSRDFKDTVQAQNSGLSDYAAKKMAARFSDKIPLFQKGLTQLGAQIVDGEYPYDLSAVLQVLPRIPLLILFNDRDEQFPAEAFILYESRAHHFLDAECRVMIDWCLYNALRGIEQV